jgi:type I restriction enzyme, S subunit
MSFPRYPRYKDSGVEWLGEVPEHWEVSTIKRCFHIVGGSTPKSDVESFWNGDVLWATPSDLGNDTTGKINHTQRTITTSGLESCSATVVPAGSIVLSTRAPIGSLAVTSVPMATNQGCKSLVAQPSICPEYFAYVLSVNTAELNILGKGTTFLELSADDLVLQPQVHSMNN